MPWCLPSVLAFSWSFDLDILGTTGTLNQRTSCALPGITIPVAPTFTSGTTYPSSSSEEGVLPSSERVISCSLRQTGHVHIRPAASAESNIPEMSSLSNMLRLSRDEKSLRPSNALPPSCYSSGDSDVRADCSPRKVIGLFFVAPVII